MSDLFHIPPDMIDGEASESLGGTVVSIRDMMIALGATDGELRELDRKCQLRDEILARDPWRDKRSWRKIGETQDGSPIEAMEGGIDWSGTEMQEIVDRDKAEWRSKPHVWARREGDQFVQEVYEWDGAKWVPVRHADSCECVDCMA